MVECDWLTRGGLRVVPFLAKTWDSFLETFFFFQGGSNVHERQHKDRDIGLKIRGIFTAEMSTVIRQFIFSM